MEKDEKVIVTLQKEKSAYQSRLIKESDATGGVLKNKNMEVKPLEVGQSFDIKDIVFATNSSELDEDARFILDNFLNKVLAEDDYKVDNLSPFLEKEAFESKYGKAPWTFVNSILERLNLPYEVNNPLGTKRDSEILRRANINTGR